MEKTESTIVTQLRRMAHQKHTPSQMLREIIPLLGEKIPHKLTLIAHMRDAFHLTLAEASPIAGWWAHLIVRHSGGRHQKGSGRADRPLQQ